MTAHDLTKARPEGRLRPPRFIRALILAYSYVLTGKKVDTPYNWKDI